MRAHGFYWCKNPTEWEIALWVPEGELAQGWRIFNDWKIYQDSYFQEIDERRIERTERAILPDGDYDPIMDNPLQHLSDNPYLCKPD